ncbi:MAG: family 43 glycosylhydrolase [Lachnospiraceae bacterium]|nr:family 43 glycosylhydrolase [Lachnospiraceae bacterium]
MEKRQAFNPYLPSWEYVPDGEPHVFGDRVYVYGSHDRFGGPLFCMNDYVCWSAPVDDLSEWKNEGVIYQKKQDPALPIRCLYAPDVCRGPDGRYYLYYAYDFLGIMGVAAADRPEGPYEFYGHVKFPDGHKWGRKNGEPFPFDPGIFVDDDGRVFLYSGFYKKVPSVAMHLKQLTFDGGVVLELEQDMVTIKSPPKLIFPKEGEGAFPDHEFFEASSMRKIGNTYYFIYSSKNNHELCYATSAFPDGGFVFGGTLIDIGDCYLDGRTEETALNYMGNTHGSIANLNGKWYVFYHRQTNQHSFSRQACAEPLRFENGKFYQAEISSSGLNGGPLRGTGRYEARIACNLWAKGRKVGRYDVGNPRKDLAAHPYFTQTGKDREQGGDQYIANMRDGATAGYKYFDFNNLTGISVELKGAAGTMEVSCDPDFGQVIARIPVQNSPDYTEYRIKAGAANGVHPLYFRYCGDGAVDFRAFTLY